MKVFIFRLVSGGFFAPYFLIFTTALNKLSLSTEIAVAVLLTRMSLGENECNPTGRFRIIVSKHKVVVCSYSNNSTMSNHFVVVLQYSIIS